MTESEEINLRKFSLEVAERLHGKPKTCDNHDVYELATSASIIYDFLSGDVTPSYEHIACIDEDEGSAPPTIMHHGERHPIQ